MPGGVPVATMAIGDAGAVNAALFAAAIIAVTDSRVADRLQNFRSAQTRRAIESEATLDD
jgi:5-(carboxyamino)imidazole ribonucleotide mutase